MRSLRALAGDATEGRRGLRVSTAGGARRTRGESDATGARATGATDVTGATAVTDVFARGRRPSLAPMRGRA